MRLRQPAHTNGHIHELHLDEVQAEGSLPSDLSSELRPAGTGKHLDGSPEPDVHLQDVPVGSPGL